MIFPVQLLYSTQEDILTFVISKLPLWWVHLQELLWATSVLVEVQLIVSWVDSGTELTKDRGCTWKTFTIPEGSSKYDGLIFEE